jgi:ketosteroid isomerase-like protein
MQSGITRRHEENSLALRETNVTFKGSGMAEKLELEAERVKALDLELIDAFRRADFNALDRILAEEFTFTDPHGPPLSKQNFLDGMKSASLVFNKVEVLGLDVTTLGDTALVHGKVRMEARSSGGGYSGIYHYTDVFVKHDGSWRVLLSTARHIQCSS